MKKKTTKVPPHASRRKSKTAEKVSALKSNKEKVKVNVASGEGEVTSDREFTSVAAPNDDLSAAEVARRKRTWAVAGNRWIREGRRAEVDAFREIVRLECQARGMSRLEALHHSWAAAMAAFPPKGEMPGIVAIPVKPQTEPAPSAKADPAETAGTADAAPVGLYTIPADWPLLPANASLAADIAWVQSNRLAMVEERPGGKPTRVHLNRAHEPAPSRAALGWLETSVRSYGKYVDVAARAASAQVDAQEQVQHERLALDAVRALLNEMIEDKDAREAI